jgi:RAMP superfamily protein
MTVGHPWAMFELARVTVEMTSAFQIASGEGDGLVDLVFATDANGLPTLPGETVAGILRHGLAGGEDPERHGLCRTVFGFQGTDSGEASRVQVSYGQAHGSDDRPVPFRQAPPNGDPVLDLLRAGVSRDHVRIGPHGAVDGPGKFDELLVPPGARFTFELTVRGDCPRSARDILELLSRSEVRMGRGGRRGLGRLRVVRAMGRHFDLSQAKDRQDWAALPVGLHLPAGALLPSLEPVSSRSGPEWVQGSLKLKPVDTWLFGGTVTSGREPKRKGLAGWDRFPVTERRITWTRTEGRDQGVVTASKDAPYLVPGSSVKGALRHRTAFHLRRLEGRWASEDPADAKAAPGPLEGEVALFGAEAGSESPGPGRVFVEDAAVPAATPLAPFQHVSLDRFTQGPRDGLLFDEVAVHGGAIEIGLAVHHAGLPAPARLALAAALDDLCHRRLALGAGRSHGRFVGTAEWTDGGAWLAGGEP